MCMGTTTICLFLKIYIVKKLNETVKLINEILNSLVFIDHI